jgi:hypothetical protein
MTVKYRPVSAETKSGRKLKHYIHVNRNRMFANRAGTAKDLPVIAVRRGRAGKPRYCRKVLINGPSEVVYDTEHPLCSGAQVWIEVPADVEVVRVGEEVECAGLSSTGSGTT